MLVDAFGFAFSLISTSLQGTTPALIGQMVTDSFDQFLIGAIVASMFTGLALVLFTYALQTSGGKILLWIAYAANIGTGILTFFIISQELASAVQQATSGPGSVASLATSLQSLQGEAQVLGLLGFIPAIIDSTAYYFVRSRITRGEVPEPPKPAGAIFPATKPP